MTDVIEWMAERYVRLTLAPDTRARIYTTLAMLLENNVQLVSALDKLYDVFTDGGTSKSPLQPSSWPRPARAFATDNR